VGRVRSKRATWPLFWPGLIGVLVFALIAQVSPPPSEGPFQLVWLLCVFATSWFVGWLVWAVLNPKVGVDPAN
jgi:hypothetical protein